MSSNLLTVNDEKEIIKRTINRNKTSELSLVLTREFRITIEKVKTIKGKMYSLWEIFPLKLNK